MKSYPKSLLAIALATTISLSLSSKAAVLASEDFTAYPVNPSPLSSIDTKNGGTGFGSAWNAPSGQGFANESRNDVNNLSYPNYPTIGGNYLNLYGLGGSNNNFAQRSVDLAGNFSAYSDGTRVGLNGTTLWGSFAYSLVNGSANFFLQGASNSPTIVLSQTNNNLFVFKIDFGIANVDTFSIYNNPNLTTFNATSTPSSTLTGDFSFITLGFQAFSDAEVRVDNIRLGNSVGDVTPVPEPSAVMLIGLGGVLALVLRKKMKGSLV